MTAVLRLPMARCKARRMAARACPRSTATHRYVKLSLSVLVGPLTTRASRQTCGNVWPGCLLFSASLRSSRILFLCLTFARASSVSHHSNSPCLITKRAPSLQLIQFLAPNRKIRISHSSKEALSVTKSQLTSPRSRLSLSTC